MNNIIYDDDNAEPSGRQRGRGTRGCPADGRQPPAGVAAGGDEGGRNATHGGH